MATHFQHNCPHCQTKSAGFTVSHQWGVRGSSQQAQLLAICGICTRGITILAKARVNTFPSLLQNSIVFPNETHYIVDVWPKFIAEVPSGTPENVGAFYRQGLDSLQERRWDAAGAMFRKTLDTGTKFIASEHKTISLYARINKLVENGVLTPAMGDWSHELRLDGNDAVHDEEPETEEDAKKAQRFAEAFLNYVFTLPELVASSRSARLAESA